MKYHVIYDGNCNLCVSFVQRMEDLDRGQTFNYIPMQDEESLKEFGISSQDCELGIILIDAAHPERRWQGSDAVEEIASHLPVGKPMLDLYRSFPGMKWLGDRAYEQVRNNRYQWFGKRKETYHSPHRVGCQPQNQGKAE